MGITRKGALRRHSRFRQVRRLAYRASKEILSYIKLRFRLFATVQSPLGCHARFRRKQCWDDMPPKLTSHAPSPLAAGQPRRNIKMVLARITGLQSEYIYVFITF